MPKADHAAWPKVDEVAETIARLIEVYLDEREDEHETFLQTARRIGVKPFKKRVAVGGRGKSVGVRTLLAYRVGEKAFFVSAKPAYGHFHLLSQ